MTTRRELLGMASVGVVAAGFAGSYWLTHPSSAAVPDASPASYPIHHSDAEWRSLLSSASYQVLRQDATEVPFSSPLLLEHRAGIFLCAGCATKLYSSSTKFDSHTGWPSFWDALPHAVERRADDSLGMSRTEVHCTGCGGHLGHVFDDGPKPTGLRYCMNGAAMAFKLAVA